VEVEVDPEHVAAAVRSERHLRVDGRALAGFAPLSRFWETADGWVRTHANYPWHREALLRALRAGPDTVAEAIARLSAAEVEARVYAAGGLAVAVRTQSEWRAACGDTAAPRIDVTRIPGAHPRSGGRLRVLDFTRVIAGPVGTRMLGALGADVLRVDPPGRPELELHQWDGLLAKRSAILDLADPRRERLLAAADVVIIGYRPGALDRFGLAPAVLAERHPGLVVVSLTAWGNARGFASRRGFDSLVQAATGIALEYGRPGALPCQLLDHATGYLIAASALEGVAAQREQGGTIIAELALAATAAELLRRPPVRDDDPDPTPYLVELGPRVTAVAPPGRLDGRPLSWPGPPTRYGADEPEWLD
jgi:CoA-transferase family III